jgi:hypothetical protein
VASSMPAAEPIWVNDPKSPRLRTGACSTDSSAEPPHSAPADRPWMMRRTTSETAAHQPMAAKFGTSPMSVDAVPMDSRETDEQGLATDSITEVAGNDSAQRAGKESDGQGGEGSEPASELTAGGEELDIEDQRCRSAVEVEVVPLDRRSGERRDQHPLLPGKKPGVSGLGGRIGDRGLCHEGLLSRSFERAVRVGFVSFAEQSMLRTGHRDRGASSTVFVCHTGSHDVVI